MTLPVLLEINDRWRSTGERSTEYNCLSWCVGITDEHLWPSHKVADIDKFFAEHGLVPLSPGEPEAEADVALWMKNGLATHASKRWDTDWWESKMGWGPRVLHRLRDLGVRPSNPFWTASGGLEVATAVFRMRSQTSGSVRRLVKPFWGSYCATT